MFKSYSLLTFVQFKENYLVKRVIFLCVLVFFTFYAFANNNHEPVKVTNSGAAGDFPLVDNSNVAATVVIDSSDAEVVAVAASAFSHDVNSITGIPLDITQKLDDISYPVIIGTLGQSKLIDSLASTGKISIDNVQGKWETFCISVVSNPFEGFESALVIFGSDPRGTAFGVFELSRMMGVSPWVWWADVTPEPKSSLYVTAGESIFGPPSVKFRGMFLNDEDWGLNPWAAKNMDTGIKDIGPNTYAKIFELMLRLKANYIWPAMHDCTKAFWYYPGNPEMARKYDIVLGSSHAEPMLRNNVDEWLNNLGYPASNWNWATNSALITDYWKTRVVESKNNDAVYTTGMRGVHDSGMTGYSTNQDKANALKDIIATQRNLLTTYLEKPASEVPQMFCPYKEALTLYNIGLNLADDITLTWVDDNFGYIRQLSNPAEQQRSGGAGVYYHLSYWGSPEDYLWLSTTSPSLISFEMSKAYELNAKNLWVFNVGDIKPAEMEFQFAMDMAWDKSSWTPDNAWSYSKQWAAETFGNEFADKIAGIKEEYYRLASSGKPEHVALISYSNQEMEKRLADYSKLVEMSKNVEASIPERLKDAYFQLIAYPVEGAASMNEKILYARKSLQLASEGNTDALIYSDKSRVAYQNIISLTNKYNTGISGGKWNGMMDYAPRKRPQFYQPTVATADNINTNGVSLVEDSTIIIPAQNFVAKSGTDINTINGLGENGCAVTVWPMNMTTYTASNISSAPYVEYDVPVVKGSNNISVKCLPSFPLYPGMQLRYAISVAGKTPAFVDIATAATSGQWSQNVINQYAVGTSEYQSNADQTIKVRIYFSDPGLVISSLSVVTISESPYTAYLKNPGFEYKSAGVLNDGSVVRGTPYAWSQTGYVPGNSFGINNDATNFEGANMCWYNVNQSPYAMPSKFELYQVVDELPAGTYIVRCKLAAMSGYITNVRLFANNNVQYYGNEADYVSNLTEGETNTFAGNTPVSGMSKALLSEMAVKVTLNEGDSLKLGIRSGNLKSDGTAGTGASSSRVYGGFKADDFRLELVGGNTNTPVTKVVVNPLIQIIGMREKVRVTIDGEFNAGFVKIYSLTGNLITEHDLHNRSTYIGMHSGAYIVRVVVDDGIINSKVVII
ncbi:glycosyl hydrolase 115 family protein [Saccharicrinis sp. FJH2]|uniref:glycosyl hydrolase 115 family protein n=1 Tax=Saccharicrinis sp. FJH65 TaxID=3344659 RepID=UPI0035F4AA0A